MTQREVEADLEDLPSSDEIIDICEGELDARNLQEIREMQLEPADALGCLWAELLQVGVDPEEFFRKKGIIE